MPKPIFNTGEYYHIYNRGVEKREVFCDINDYTRFLSCITKFNNDLGETGRAYLSNIDVSRGSDFDRGELALQKSDFTSKINKSNSGLNQPKSDFGPSDISSKSGFNLLSLVKIIAYTINPNHYHFILQQSIDNGISTYMHKIGTSYTKYFNLKYNRSGHLFQGKFKASHINSNERLLWLSAYVNGNAEIHKIAKATDWQWSSYQEYLEKSDNNLCDKK